jgi:hypothetical protein
VPVRETLRQGNGGRIKVDQLLEPLAPVRSSRLSSNK